MKVLVDPHSGKLLGGAILGGEGGEIMAMLRLAMMGNLPYHSLKRRGLRAPDARGVAQ
jgi:pyruvate/2-oxoglutarate dehydrogenase complex dihydrolipoamide dehydrogenase (E3) component